MVKALIVSLNNIPKWISGPLENAKTRGLLVKAKYSGKDKNGKEYTDCSECERGGNGNDKDKCPAGWRHKKGGQGMCFLGTLKKGLEIDEPKKQDVPDYAYKTIEEYEELAGFKVNEAFKGGWAMARVTNEQLDIVSK